MRRSAVPASTWRRGLAACERIGVLLRSWEERGRAARDGSAAPPRRTRRRRRTTPS